MIKKITKTLILPALIFFGFAQFCFAQAVQDTDTMYSLAQNYVLSKKYVEAKVLYKKILAISPTDKIALNNLKYVNQQMQNNQLVSSLNSMKSCAHAPAQVYALLKPEDDISCNDVINMKYMLDLIWSDSTGRILLTSLAQKHIPINITTQDANDANATMTQSKNTLYVYGFIPIFSANNSKLEVNIPQVHIENFMNQNLSSTQRIYSLHALVHEFCHAYRFINFPQSHNSLEEELTASMIGFNVSYKVLTGHGMTQEQTKVYSHMIYKSLLGDSHCALPPHSGFIQNMLSKGIDVPCPNVYANIVKN